MTGQAAASVGWDGSGFEGSEKRLELSFRPVEEQHPGSLRDMSKQELGVALSAAKCDIVSWRCASHLSNRYMLGYPFPELGCRGGSCAGVFRHSMPMC